MSNIAFVTLKGGSFSAPKVEAALLEILQEKWGSRITMDGSDGWWSLTWPNIVYISFGIRNPRRLSLKPGSGFLTLWAESYLQQSLAKRFGAICSDEGVPQKWRGTPEKINTYEKWYKLVHGGWGTEEQRVQRWEEHLKWLAKWAPDALSGMS